MNAARTGRFCGPQDAHGRRLSWDARRRAYGHGSWRASPGGAAKWAHKRSFVRLAGVLPGQRCSQHPYVGATSAPRARGTLTVPTAYYRSHMVAVHGRPGRICPRVGDCGFAFFNFWAGWPGGSPAWTHSSYTPTQPHNPGLSIVHRVCVCAS